MPRLLFLTDHLPPEIGGLARSSDRIVQALTHLGLTIDVFTWTRSLAAGEVKSEPGYGAGRIYRLGRYRHWDTTLMHSLNVLDWLQETSGYAALWGHYLFPAGFVATWFGRLRQLPTTVSARGNDLEREMFPPGDFARLQWTLTNADVVTAVSHEMAHRIRCLVNREALVLANTVDTTIFQPPQEVDLPQILALRRSLGIADEELVMGFSGELRQKKGQAFLLQALTTVRQQIPACLLIIGEVRPTPDAPLQVYSHQHPEDGQRVKVTGHWSEPALVAQHLQLCQVYLQPSLWEGMPNALLEAMACGLGCIASDAGGIPEILSHGETGFILPRSRLHHLGEAVLEWQALEPGVQQQIGQRARQYILQHHSLKQESAQLQAVITRLIPKPS